MKTLLMNFRIMAILAVMCGFVSCVEPQPDEPDKPSTDVEKPDDSIDPYLRADLLASMPESIEIKVETAALDSIAYICYESRQDALQASIIFLRGTKVKAESEGTVKITSLKADSRYYLYFAGKAGSKYYGEIVEVEAKTAAYDFSDLLTLVETGQRSYKVHINVPESVENDDTRSIRYGYCSIPMYMSNKLRGMHDTDLLYQNGQVDTRVDKTIDVNIGNEYLLDENGNPVYDEETGEPIQLHEPVVPGEPVIFFAGEFEWGEGYIANWGPAGDGFGYFIPLYDLRGYYGDDWGQDEEEDVETAMTRGIVTDVNPGSDEHQYWTGAFQKMVFTLDQPDLLDAEIEVRVEDLTAVDATVTIIPDENVYGYNYCVMDEGTYQGILTLLCGREDWMQWFVSSYYAQFSFMIGNAGSEAVQFPVSDTFFVGPLNEQSDFHIFITARGNEDGTTQKFIHEVFTTKAKVLDPPVVNVTAVENGMNEYEAKFNIKAPNKDLVSAYYGADYIRDWVVTINGGATYASLCQNYFSADELEKINSDEGLTISIASLDGETTRLAVLGYNEEYTPNILFDGCSAIADCKTRMLDMVPHVNSPLFDDLVGDWTMTAKAYVVDYDDNNNKVEYTTNITSKVSIFNKIETPELTQDVYDIYYESDDMSAAAVDALYDDFKKQADHFNNYRLHYRNRLLCLGWYDYDIYQFSRLTARTPFELFKATDYSSYDNAMIMYDFGPKWYLEIAEDGTVKVPFDQMAMPPMTNWQDTPFFVGAYNRESNHGYRGPGEDMPGAFPVEISADKNTIVIKGIEASLDNGTGQKGTHYMNAIGGWGQYDAQIIRPIISEITLKRGWTETKAFNAPSSSRRNYVEKPELSSEDCTPVVWKSMTEFEEPVKVRKVEPSIVTMEQVEKALEKYSSRYHRR